MDIIWSDLFPILRRSHAITEDGKLHLYISKAAVVETWHVLHIAACHEVLRQV